MQGELIVVECDRCKTKLIGWLGEDKKVKVNCNCCGTTNVLWATAPRTYFKKIVLPKGQRLY